MCASAGEVADLGKQLRQASDSLAEAHRRREVAAKKSEEAYAEAKRWERVYRKLAVENMSLLSQLNGEEL